MRFRMLQPATVLAVALLLTSCVPNTSEITPAPEPTSTTIFATDEDALAAATAAYAKYLEVSDEIFRNGGTGLDALQGVLIGKQLDVERNGFIEVEREGWHSVGTTTFDQVRLQNYDQRAQHEAVITAYVCEDISGTDVVDKTGKSVVAAKLPRRSLYEVSFDINGDSKLLVSDKQRWGGGEC